MSRRRRPAIPRIPLSADRETSSFFKAVKEALEIAIGDRGDVLDSNPTWRDLVDADIASAANAAYNRGSVGSAVLPDALTPYEDQTIPPAPTNVSVTATTGNVYITYDQPAGTYISHAEIYHAEVEAADPAPAVGDAVFLGRGYLIGVFQHSVEPVSRHFYWVRFVSYAGKYGPWHNLAGSEITAPQDPAAYLTLLTDQIDATHLSAILESRIDLIDAPSTGLVDGLAQEILDRNSGDTNLQGQITTINSTLNHGTTGLAATYSKAVAAETVANTADGKADVNSTEILAARGGESSLDARLQVMSSVSTDLGALWTVTQDVNGYVTGFGIYNTGATSLARFNVAQFAIASPGASELSFVVDGTNVVMNGAFIQDATITSAKINNVTVDKITGDTANFVLSNIGTGNITNAMIGNVIESNGFIPGSTGWRINKDGSAEFHNITVYDGAGNVVLQSGSPIVISYSNVTGLGDLAPLDVVTSTYIADAAVDSLKLAGNAATILEQASFANGWADRTWGSIGSHFLDHGLAETIPMQIAVSGFIVPRIDAGTPWASGYIGVRFLVDGVVIKTAQWLVAATWADDAGNRNFTILDVVDIPSGGSTVTVETDGNRGAGHVWTDVTLSALAAKR